MMAQFVHGPWHGRKLEVVGDTVVVSVLANVTVDADPNALDETFHTVTYRTRLARGRPERLAGGAVAFDLVQS